MLTNRLTSVNGVPYTWDNNGNLTNDGSKTYFYNQANQLTGITAAGLTWSAAYNGDGARLQQTANGVPTTYTLDLAAPLVTALTERTGATTKQYVYSLGDSPMAVYTGTLSGAEGWTYLSGRDGLNSVRQETDAAGNVLTTRSFDPYGVPLQGGGGTPFGYTGEPTDVTGLAFLRARYMQPVLGMFLSRDPLLTSSPYRYASGNPINRSDPSGYIDWPMCVNVSPYRICTTEQGDNIYQIARLINNAGIGLPGNEQAIRQIVSTIYGDNSYLLYGGIKANGDFQPGISLRLNPEWVAAVINSGLAPTPMPPTPQPPVAPPHSIFDTSGYIEGKSTSVVGLLSIRSIEGEEVVYDFATMERGRFRYTGYPDTNGSSGFCVSAGGAATSRYAGEVMGFTENNDIQKDYQGPFVSLQVGIGGKVLGIEVSGGVVGFSSANPGNAQPNFQVFGADAYYDVGKGILGLPLATMVTNYTMESSEDYKGDIHRMAQDILSGKDAPMLANDMFRRSAARQALAWWGK